MSDQTTDAAKDLALAVVNVLVERIGGETALEILDIVEGKGLDQTLMDLSILARGFLSAIEGVIEPAAVRTAIQAGYVAANAAGDAALKAKFGKP